MVLLTKSGDASTIAARLRRPRQATRPGHAPRPPFMNGTQTSPRPHPRLSLLRRGRCATCTSRRRAPARRRHRRVSAFDFNPAHADSAQGRVLTALPSGSSASPCRRRTTSSRPRSAMPGPVRLTRPCAGAHARAPHGGLPHRVRRARLLSGSGWKTTAHGEVCAYVSPTDCANPTAPRTSCSRPRRRPKKVTTRTSASSACRNRRRADASLRRLSLALYGEAEEHARARGIIIADTKFELGATRGRVLLIDEALTPTPRGLARRTTARRSEPSFDSSSCATIWRRSRGTRAPPAPPLPPAVARPPRSVPPAYRFSRATNFRP